MLLEFDYINWRGEPHRYLVRPEQAEMGPLETPYEGHWVLHAQVIDRDGAPRPRRRTFILVKMDNMREVAGE